MGVEGQTWARRTAVERVPQDRESKLGEVDPHLVGATGVEPRLHD